MKEEEWIELRPPTPKNYDKRPADYVAVSVSTEVPPNAVRLAFRGKYVAWGKKAGYVAIALSPDLRRLRLRPSPSGFRFSVFGKFENAGRLRLTIPQWPREERDQLLAEVSEQGECLIITLPEPFVKPREVKSIAGRPAVPAGAMGGGRR